MTVTLTPLVEEELKAIHQMRADERVAKRCQIAAAHTDTCISKEDSGPLREQLVHAAIIAALKEQEEHIRNSPSYRYVILDGTEHSLDPPDDLVRPQGDRTEVARTGMAAGLPRPGDDDTCAPPPADCAEPTPAQAHGPTLLSFLDELVAEMRDPNGKYGDHQIDLEASSHFDVSYPLPLQNLMLRIMIGNTEQFLIPDTPANSGPEEVLWAADEINEGWPLRVKAGETVTVVVRRDEHARPVTQWNPVGEHDYTTDDGSTLKITAPDNRHNIPLAASVYQFANVHIHNPHLHPVTLCRLVLRGHALKPGGTARRAQQQHPIVHEVAQKRTAYVQALARANQSANEYDAKCHRMKNASHAADADNKDADFARTEYFNALAEAVKQGQGPNIG